MESFLIDLCHDYLWFEISYLLMEFGNINSLISLLIIQDFSSQSCAEFIKQAKIILNFVIFFSKIGHLQSFFSKFGIKSTILVCHAATFTFQLRKLLFSIFDILVRFDVIQLKLLVQFLIPMNQNNMLLTCFWKHGLQFFNFIWHRLFHLFNFTFIVLFNRFDLIFIDLFNFACFTFVFFTIFFLAFCRIFIFRRIIEIIRICTCFFFNDWLQKFSFFIKFFIQKFKFIFFFSN